MTTKQDTNTLLLREERSDFPITQLDILATSVHTNLNGTSINFKFLLLIIERIMRLFSPP